MHREHNYGEDKPPIKLSNDTIDNEPTLESGHTDLSTPDIADCISAATNKASNYDDSRALGCSLGDEKTASLKHGDAHEQAYSQDISKESNTTDTLESESKTPSEQPSSDIEKHTTAHPICSNDLPAINDGALSRTQSTVPNEANGEDDTYPEGGLRAYSVVLGSFCGMTASFGILNSVGTFQAYLSTNQLKNETPPAIGWIFSLYAFLTFFCGVQIGPIFDAKGPRWLVFPGSVCIFAGLMGVAESTSMRTILQISTTSALTMPQNYGTSSSRTPSYAA